MNKRTPWKSIGISFLLAFLVVLGERVFAEPIRLMVVPIEPSSGKRPVRVVKPPSLEIVEVIESKLRPLLDETYKLLPARDVLANPNYDVKMPFSVNAISFEENNRPLQVLIKVHVTTKKETGSRGKRKKTVYFLEGEIQDRPSAKTFPISISIPSAQKKKGKWEIMGLEGACINLAQDLEGSVKPLYHNFPKKPNELPVAGLSPQGSGSSSQPTGSPQATELKVEIPEDIKPVDTISVRSPAGALAPPEYVLMEQESPLAVKKEKPKERYPWWSLFDIRLGYARTGRKLTVNDFVRFPGNAPSDFAGTHGLLLLAEVYPLAYIPRLPPVFSQLGVQYAYSQSFWAPIQTVNPMGMPFRQADAKEWRMEGALHWSMNLANKAWIPMPELDGLYGYHTFTLLPSDGEKSGFPSVAYHYAGGRVGMHWFLSRWVELGARWMGATLLQLGDVITSPEYYGAGSGWMWRVEGELGINIKGITVRGQVWYERKNLAFEGNGQPQPFLTPPASAGNVTDESLMVAVTAGFRLSPKIHSAK